MQESQQSTNEFTSWLQKKLIKLNTDPDVFGSYITGILDGEESLEEKREALNDILSEIITNDIESLISLILEKFESSHPKEEKKTDVHIDVSEQLAKLLVVQKLPTNTKTREYTEEERQIREQILAQYSQTEVEDVEAYCSDEDTEGSNGVSNSTNSLTGIERNTNVQDVMALQKEKREQARMDSAAKKQKDKEDRERQKQLREEKKEKRKTVKGERRR